MNRTSLWWAKGGLAVSQSITPLKRAASRPTHPRPSLALDALAAIGQTLRKSRQANVPQTPGFPCRMTCVSRRSPADGTGSSSVVQLAPRPPWHSWAEFVNTTLAIVGCLGLGPQPSATPGPAKQARHSPSGQPRRLTLLMGNGKGDALPFLGGTRPF